MATQRLLSTGCFAPIEWLTSRLPYRPFFAEPAYAYAHPAFCHA
jgi:hypothetical protein